MLPPPSPLALLQRIMDAGVPVVVNQVQFSLLDRRPLNGMVQLAKERGVKVGMCGMS